MKLNALAAVVLLSTALLPHAQAAVVSTTSSGVITDGLDTLALFGDAGASLEGLHYQLTFSADIDDQTLVNDSSFSQVYSYGAAPVNYSVTINNHTLSGTISIDAWNQQLVAAGRTDSNPNNGVDQLSGYASGYGADYASYVDINHYAYSSVNSFAGIALNLLSSVTREIEAGDYGGTYFSFYDFNAGSTTYFNGTADVFSLNGTGQVPEPATLGIFGLGLAGLAATRRKRARQ